MLSKNNLVKATLEFVGENRPMSWYYFLSTLFLAIVAYSATWLFPFTWAKIISGVLAGVMMTRLFVIYHDYQHGAILKDSALAKFLMTLFGIFSLAPNSIWNETHEHHHHHNSRFSKFVIGSFPTLSVHTFKALSKAQKTKYLVIRHPLMIVFAYIPIFLVSFCLWPFFENPKRYWDCGLAAAIHIGITITLITWGGWIVWCCSMLIPSFLMYALGGYIFYAQHNFTTVVLHDDDVWDYLDAALYSSSYIKMNMVMRWITANIGYHHIHHVNSRIPFYRLPEVMQKFPELQNPGTTSLHPREVWRCLQLKLWDEDKRRMITLSELKMTASH